jgi:hypothetical protein
MGDIEMQMITCSMCGHRFDPASHSGCRSCPLQSGCQLVCCPACGFETVNPDRSILARLAKRWLSPGEKNHNPDLSRRS